MEPPKKSLFLYYLTINYLLKEKGHYKMCPSRNRTDIRKLVFVMFQIPFFTHRKKCNKIIQIIHLTYVQDQCSNIPKLSSSHFLIAASLLLPEFPYCATSTQCLMHPAHQHTVCYTLHTVLYSVSQLVCCFVHTAHQHIVC